MHGVESRSDRAQALTWILTAAATKGSPMNTIDSTLRGLAFRFAACALGAVAAASATADDSAPGWSESLARNRPWQAATALAESPQHAQISAQVQVFLGKESAACALRPSRAPQTPEGAEYRDAIEVIARAARDARVVMLNESHFRRAHRLFLRRSIEALDALGFDALAAETFAADGPATLVDGVPDAGTGFYTADPAFADALRRAHALGWTFVAYEPASVSDRQTRETAQAAALASWLEAHPGRRLLVYAGGAHISENPEEGWMAARLRARTGIDPLTIAQGPTACAGDTEIWPMDSSTPQVAVRDGQPIAGAHVDLVVLHPPAAVATAADARGAPAALCLPPRAERTLLRAFAEGEDDDAIARDQVVVPAGANVARLRLPPGRYRIAREDDRELRTQGYVTVRAKSSRSCLRIGAR
jgi:hypothetical protein